MRLNPVNVQNVVTYNVVINVDNPEQKLKPGMTANLTITIDERNNVLKVPNSASFTPQDARTAHCAGAARGQGQGRAAATQQQGDNAAGNGESGHNFAPVQPSVAGSVGCLGDGPEWQTERRRITRLERASRLKVVDGELKEGDMVLPASRSLAARTETRSQPPPDFGNAPRTGGGGAGPRQIR
jgi:HlyD family secretion protein